MLSIRNTITFIFIVKVNVRWFIMYNWLAGLDQCIFNAMLWCFCFSRAVLSALPYTQPTVSTMYHPHHHLLFQLVQPAALSHYGCLAASVEWSTVWWAITVTITCCSRCESSRRGRVHSQLKPVVLLHQTNTMGVFNQDSVL